MSGAPLPNILANENWSFALKIYAEPGVAEACLFLQAEAGADVVMVLTAAFAASRRGILLSSSDIRDMDDNCRQWREQIVRPLRMLRVALKTGPPPAPNAVTEPLRSEIKAAELVAERLQNNLLADWLQQNAPAARLVTSDEVRIVLRSVVEFAKEVRSTDSINDHSPAIDVITSAAQRLARQWCQ
jgi:uncharacterized protein (TIGR02444 family)